MLFRQLFDQESSTFSYLLADEKSKEAVILDPVREKYPRDSKLIKELGLSIKYVIETHIHADHITSAASFVRDFGATIVVGKNSGLKAPHHEVSDGDFLSFGSCRLKALWTPGHTDSSFSFLIGHMVFTGDLLFVRGTGRTDFQNGSSSDLLKSIREKIFSLPDETEIYPGHDYQGFSKSTVFEEKNFNPRVGLQISDERFHEIMQNLKLAPPKKINEAVPANLKAGDI